MVNRSGRPNGTSREPFDRWFRYPAGFSQTTLAMSYELLDPPPAAMIVDPFAGSGSAGTYLARRGHTFRGIEAHPLISELADLKLRRPPPTQELREAGEKVRDSEASVDLAEEHPLVARSFDCTSLAVLTGMRDHIRRTPERLARYLRWALTGTLRECASVKVGWPYQLPGSPRQPVQANPRRAFARRLDWICQDLEEHFPGASRVVCGDSRMSAAWRRSTRGGPAAALLTSPPYLNNFDYADATRLELYFWRLASSWKEMVEGYRGKMMTATTQQTTVGAAQRATSHLERTAPAVAPEVVRITNALKGERLRRRRGKEYDRLIPAYFADMSLVLRQAARHLTPASPVGLVVGDSAPYGVHIDTPRILVELAECLGFSFEGAHELRTRGYRWVSNGSRHRLPLREDLILLRSPYP